MASKLLYGKIDTSEILHKFTASTPFVKIAKGSRKLSMNTVWSGAVNRFNRHAISHPFHKVAAEWIGGSISVEIDKIQKVDPRTGRTKTSRKSRTVYHNGTINVDEPVELWFVYKFRTRPLDSGNCQAMSKLFEDGLVRCGFCGNDTNEYVTWVANLSLPMDESERDNLEKDVVELYILKSSI